MGELRILLGDDHTVLATRTSQDPRRAARLAVAEAGTGAMPSVRRSRSPGCRHSRYRDAALNGIEATRQIVRRAPSVHADPRHAQRPGIRHPGPQAGARGYLLKESAGAELLEAIATLAAKSYFSQSVGQVVFDDYVKTLE